MLRRDLPNLDVVTTTEDAFIAPIQNAPNAQHNDATVHATAEHLKQNKTVGGVPYVVPKTNGNEKDDSFMQARSGLKSGYKNGQTSNIKYFDPYDPWIGIRTAIILGGFLLLLVVYILYKARCRLGGSIEETKTSYYQQYKDSQRERILANIRARNQAAMAAGDGSDRDPEQDGHPGPERSPSLEFTAKWIQTQPLYDAIPDDGGSVRRTPNLSSRRQDRLHLSDIELHMPSPDFPSPYLDEEKAYYQINQESNQERYCIDQGNFTTTVEVNPICDGNVPRSTDPLPQNACLDINSELSPSKSNILYHEPLVHRPASDSVDENSNWPERGTGPVGGDQDDVVSEITPTLKDDKPGHPEPQHEKPKSIKKQLVDRTLSCDTDMTNESRPRSQSHNSLIPSASSLSSGLELIETQKLTANGGPKILATKKSRSNGNIVQMDSDDQYSLWRKPKEEVTKL